MVEVKKENKGSQVKLQKLEVFSLYVIIFFQDICLILKWSS